MPPMMRKSLDIVIALALTAAAFFVIVVANSSLMARGGTIQGVKLWYAFIGRPDILGTMILTALVTIGYVMWQQNGGRRG